MANPIHNIVIFQKAVLFDEQGRLLALKRRDEDVRRTSCWDLPGGGLEQHEDVVEAIKREILEETGLIAIDLQPIHVQTVTMSMRSGVDNLYIGWQVKTWSGEIRLSDEHIEYRFVTPLEFAKLQTWDEGDFLQTTVKKIKSYIPQLILK